MATMRQLHKQYDARVRRGDYIQAWCIAGEGAKRARAENEIRRWQTRIAQMKSITNVRRAT